MKRLRIERRWERRPFGGAWGFGIERFGCGLVFYADLGQHYGYLEVAW